MKVDSNMETDRLLQRYARRRRDASMSDAKADDAFRETSAQENQGGTSHLDADELIAYAESTLPGATRMRYTSHLSDCDSCRKLATELVLSSGVAAKLETPAVPKDQGHARSWRDGLAAIFAPRVLRYAAPVILLAGITAIALMVFRGGRDPKFRTSQSQTENGSLNGNTTGTTPRNDGVDREKNNNVQTPARDGEEVSKTDTVPDAPATSMKDAPQDGPVVAQKTGQEQEEAKPPAPAAVTTGNLSGERSAVRDQDIKVDERRQPPRGADAVEKSKAAKEVARAESTGRVARESASRAEADESSNTEGAKIAESKAPATANESAAAKRSARRNTEPAPSAPAQRTASDDRKGQASGAGNAEESRSVSGRQFVRRDGAWVDIAYRSQATTNVKRGSDQYRALVADEPGLRTIANQLGGEVVVVWKGRAYRIH